MKPFPIRLLTLLILLVTSPVWAKENYSEVLRDQYGRAIGGGTVAVYNAGTTDLATIYSDNSGTVKSNPFLTDATDGRFNFYAANGVYDIAYTYPGATFDPSHTRRISLFDINDYTAAGGSANAPIPSGATFPTPAANNYVFFLTSDSAIGDCTEGGGSAITLCRYNGSAWVAVTVSATDTLATVTANGNTSTGNDESNPFEILGTGAQASYGWSIDRTTAGESRIRCKEAAGVNKCNYYRQIDAGFKGGFKNSSGTVQFEYDEATGYITIANIDATVANVQLTLADERHFPVASCQNTTASANFDIPTSNAPAATCDTGSNTQKGYLAFDASTDESFQDSWILPTGFSSVNVHFRWKAAATSGAVGWCIQLIRVADGATSDPAFPSQTTSNCVSDTAKGTTLQENTASITGVTCSSCVAGDHVYVRISRDADGSAVTDSMTGDALLLMYGRTFVVTH
jgi:hypothetical protein